MKALTNIRVELTPAQVRYLLSAIAGAIDDSDDSHEIKALLNVEKKIRKERGQ